MNAKERRINQIDQEVKDIGMEAFWTGSKFAENHLRKLKIERDRLIEELKREEAYEV